MLLTRIPALTIALSFAISAINAQNSTNIDVQHYRFELALSDYTDMITGTATISFVVLKRSDAYFFDLGNIDSTGKGMKVVGVSSGGNSLSYIHDHDKLKIIMPGLKTGDTRSVSIQYKG